MLSKIRIFEIMAVSILGTLFHFIYDWSGENKILGVFGSVNESTCEHLKLLFWPVSFITVFEYFFIYKEKDGFLLSRFVSLAIGMIFIIVLFYTFTGIMGKSYDAFNISLYYVAVILTFFLSSIFIKNHSFIYRSSYAMAIILFLLVAGMFIAFTHRPPELGLFREP